MQSNIEISNVNIEKIIYELIELNFNDNLDDFSKNDDVIKKPKKIKKRKSEKKADDFNPFIFDICTNPLTREYLKPAILPSSKFWNMKQNVGDMQDGEIRNINQISNSIPFTLLPFPHRKLGHEDQTYIKMGTYVYVENTGIPWLTRHLENANIFFVVSPCNGYMHTITSVKSEEDLLEKRKACGKQYLADVINEVKKTIPVDARISCIVLGKREVEENMEVYDDAFYFVNREEDKEQQVEHYYLRAEDSAAMEDVDVYSINAHGHQMVLTTADLDFLHTLADKTKTQAVTDAIIVHCQQGMDRTGMLIFAFILYQNYDYYFSGENSAEKIYEAYKTLQWSRSPTALSKAADVVNAIHLAHVLKAIDIEKRCCAALNTLIFEDGTLADKKWELLSRINQAKSNRDKLDILDTELKQLTSDQNKKEYIQCDSPRKYEASKKHDSQTRRSHQSGPFRKSSSEPGELHIHRTRQESREEKSDSELEKSKSSRLSGGFFKKPKKSTSEESKAVDSLKQPLVEKRMDVVITNSTPSATRLPPTPEIADKDSNAGKEKADLEMKAVNTATNKSRNFSGIFSLKGKKGQSDMQNPLGILMSELACLLQVVQYRYNAEEALQRRIYPKEEIDSARFTIM